MLEFLVGLLFPVATTLYWINAVATAATSRSALEKFGNSCENGYAIGESACVAECPDRYFQYGKVCLSNTTPHPAGLWDWLVRWEEAAAQNSMYVGFNVAVGMLISVLLMIALCGAGKQIAWFSLLVGGGVLVAGVGFLWTQLVTATAPFSVLRFAQIADYSRTVLWAVTLIGTLAVIVYCVGVWRRRSSINTSARLIEGSCRCLLRTPSVFIFPAVCAFLQVATVGAYYWGVHMCLLYYRISPVSGGIELVEPDKAQLFVVISGCLLCGWTLVCLSHLRSIVCFAMLNGGSVFLSCCSVFCGSLLITLSMLVRCILWVVGLNTRCPVPRCVRPSGACGSGCCVPCPGCGAITMLVSIASNHIYSVSEWFTVGGYYVQISRSYSSYARGSMEWYKIRKNNPAAATTIDTASNVICAVWLVCVTCCWVGSVVYFRYDGLVDVEIVRDAQLIGLFGMLFGSAPFLGTFMDCVLINTIAQLTALERSQETFSLTL